MENMSLSRTLGVLGIFIGFFLAYFPLFLILRKLKLSSISYVIVLSLGVGLIFSAFSLGLILLSTKYDEWSFAHKLLVAGKNFPLVSIVVFIVSKNILSRYKS